MLNIEKFSKWLTDRGAEILPLTNEYELLRFKGREVGVLYKSGKTSNSYTNHAIDVLILIKNGTESLLISEEKILTEKKKKL